MAQLLDTKLQPPPLRPERVFRPYLYEDLANFETGVVVVSAPPGFGKSTVVVEWLTAQNRPFAWLSLDAYDSDVGLFSEYLGEAVAGLTGHESSLLSMPGEPGLDPRALIATVVEELADAPARSALVLDDYHEIENQDVHEAVNYLVDNLPDDLVLVIATRADPPLPLGRLRAAGRLKELRAADLRFSAEHVAEYFLAATEMDLAMDEARLISERSEGWIAALQLVKLGVDSDDPAQLADSLSGDHPHIAGYLVDEVLDRIEPELADFLIETAAFDRFDARLCRDVAGFDDASSLLADIARQNAFLIPLDRDGDWYRYHHLFADLLRSRLRRSDPDRYDALLKGAARACEARGLPDDAVDYALRANDTSFAAGIVDRNMGEALGAGEVSRLRSWLRLFPPGAAGSAHVTSLGWAWCRIFEGDLEAATALIETIEAEHLDDFATDPSGQLEVMRAMVSFQAGDVVSAESHARLSLEKLPKVSGHIECLAHLYVGRSLHAQARRPEARPHLERAASLAGQGNVLAAVTALFWLGVAQMDQGDLVAAERAMARAQEVGAAAASKGHPHPAAGVGDIGIAFIRLNQLEAEDAVHHAERGTRLLRRSAFVEMVFRAFFVWAEALSVSRRFGDAHTVVDEGIDWLQGRKIGGGPLETWLLMARARNYWRQGDLDDSKTTLDRVRTRGLGSPNEDEALGFYEAADAVSYALRRGDAARARQSLEEMPTDTTENVMFTIKHHVLRAALHELEGDHSSAVSSLEDAVEMAQVGYRFQFTFGGPLIESVLKRMIGRTRHDDFVRSVMERLPGEVERVAEQPVDPLTERELDVLAEISAGYTNDQIAERLFISRGTVKRHASNIYLKLGVHHRAEAAARGRDLGLVD